MLIFIVALGVAVLVSVVVVVLGLFPIFKSQRTRSAERHREDDHRALAANNFGRSGSLPPRSLLDAELAVLSHAQQPLTLEEAGVVARPRDAAERPGRRRRSKAS